MKRKLQLTRQVLNFLDNLPAKQFRQLFIKLISLRDNFEPEDSKPLNPYYRCVDVGEYRIVYHYGVEVVYIDVIAKRG
jgi:mRNA interferase RelE/StbE